MSERLFGDRPISHPQDDAFGLSSFADALATSLLQMSPKDGLVISVEGPWGAGKSSAIALAVRTIKLRVLIGLGEGQDQLERLSEGQLDDKWMDRAKTRKTHVVRFNPWNFSGQENLVRAFFGEMAAQLKIEPTGWVRRQFDRASSYLPAIGSSVGTGGAIFSGSALPGIAAAAGAIGKALGEIGQKAFGLDNSLEGAKKKLAEALREADQRIIVIIDDLDRLLPSEMRAVFSLVKSLGDLPGVLYVLSFDEAVVREALSQSAEKIDPAFLEKIVQVSLKLPPPWRDELRQMLFTRLTASNPPAFGSTFVTGGFASWPADRKLVGQALRQTALAIFFYAMIGNSDRGGMKPNILARGDSFRLIDHEMAFRDYMLFAKPTPPWMLGGLNGMVTPGAHIFATQLIKGAKELEFDPIRAAWAGLSDRQVEAYVAAIPPEWTVGHGLTEFAVGRIKDCRNRIDDCVTECRRALDVGT